jgi:predicted ester cyclase
MSEENKALFRRMFEEALNQGNISLIDELVAPDFVEHEELPPGIPPGREAVKDVIAEGDKVVARSTWSGTHQGEFMGIPATGKRVSFGVIDIMRFADGVVVEHWGQMDNLGMLQQLGVVPAPGEGGG